MSYQSVENFLKNQFLMKCLNRKFFEKSVFNEMFKFFIENELISPNQSGFKPGDSCINQVLAITHVITRLIVMTFHH